MHITWSDIRLPPRLSIPTWSILVAILISGLCSLTAFLYGMACESSTTRLPMCPSKTLPDMHTFVVSPGEVAQGEEATIRWSISGADTVELAAPASETVSASGSRTIRLEQDLLVTLRATNRAGSVTRSAAIKIKQAPPIIRRLTLEPASIVAGQNARLMLSWIVAGADLVTIDGVPGAPSALTGSLQLELPATEKTYRLRAQNSAGVVEQAVTLQVLSPECATVAGVAQRDGPSEKYRVIDNLKTETLVMPLGRTATGEWLRVRARLEGWLPGDAVLCRNLKVLDLDILHFSSILPEPAGTPVPAGTPLPN